MIPLCLSPTPQGYLKMIGTVIRALPNKGYAFVRGEDGLSRFCHANEFIPPESFDLLREGQGVEFTPDDNGPKGSGNGLRALKIKVISK